MKYLSTDVRIRLPRYRIIRNARLHVVRLSLPRSLSSSHHPNIPPSTYHALLIVSIIIMANVRSTSGENDIHNHHVGWNHHFILEWMYWELLDLAERATMGVL
jgi:hypothetical protein